jgi:NNP family nitrate/nitrite transporter-like MFS transporter
LRSLPTIVYAPAAFAFQSRDEAEDESMEPKALSDLHVPHPRALLLPRPRHRDAGPGPYTPPWLRRRQVATTGVGFLHYEFSYMAWVMMGALAVFIGADFGLTPAQTGVLVAMPTLTGALSRMPVGVLVDRYGCRRVGLLLLGCSMLALLLAAEIGTSYPRLLGIGALLGISGASFSVALPLAAQWRPPGRKGLAIGVVGAGNSGSVLALLLAPRVAEVPGVAWRGAFALAALPLVVAGLAWLWLARDAPAPRSRRVLALPWRSGDIYALAALYGVTCGGFLGLASFLPSYLHDEYHLSAVAAANASGLIVLCGSLARALGGHAADRLGDRPLLVGLLIVGAAGSVATALLPLAAGVSGLAVCALAVTLTAVGAGNSAVLNLAPRRFGREVATVTGAMGAVGGVGGFALPTLLGSLRDLTGSYSIGFEAFAAATLVVGLAIVVLYGDRWDAAGSGAQAPARPPGSREAGAGGQAVSGGEVGAG